MTMQAKALDAAENDLKQLMADVNRAIEKAQQAITKISPTAATTAADAGSIPAEQGEVLSL